MDKRRTPPPQQVSTLTISEALKSGLEFIQQCSDSKLANVAAAVEELCVNCNSSPLQQFVVGCSQNLLHGLRLK
jgi:hypothetical protein